MLTTEMRIAIQQAIKDSLGFAPPLSEIEESSSYKRFDTSKRNRLNGFFRVSEYKDTVSCHFGDWSKGISILWKDNSQEERKLSDEEEREIKRAYFEQKKWEEEEQKKAIKEHERFFNSLPYVDSIGVLHPYLMKKCLLKSYVAKYNNMDDTLLFPMIDSSGNFTGYQTISPTGEKKIAKGSKKKGSFYPIQFKNRDKTRFFACEGFATGLSILEATKATVIVCIDCGNLTEGIRSGARYLNIPPGKICIVADNDKSGAGEEGARKACSSLGCHYVLIPEEGMDANDYSSCIGMNKLTEFLKGVEL